MQLGLFHIDRTKDEHLREIADMARDLRTLIFLDTNVLSYLYKLHGAARREFFAWSDSVAGEQRLFIPAWVAGEYFVKVRSKGLIEYTPKNKDPEQPKKILDGMLAMCALFTDDAALRSIGFTGSRDEFLAGFRNAVEALPNFTRVFKHQFVPEDIHEEVVQHLSERVLTSDLAKLCATVSAVSSFRAEHRMPPAFCDAQKAENAFGDLIIWFEIMEKSVSAKDVFPRVLFITNDEKKDWVYAPQRRTEIVRGVRKRVANSAPELKIADPRLVSEFFHAVGHSDVVIATLPSLIEGLSKQDSQNLVHLAAAIQIDIGETTAAVDIIGAGVSAADELPPTTGQGSSEDQGVVTSDVSAAPVPAVAGSSLSYGQDALRDRLFEADEGNEINDIIRALKSHNWYVQNPAIDRIRLVRKKIFTPGAWFVLGRNIYQAACGNAQKAVDFVINVDVHLSRMEADASKHLLAGLLYEIYFDSSGKFRESPKGDLIETPLKLVASDEYETVKNFIRSELAPYQSRLRYLPGDTDKVTLLIRAELVGDELNSNVESSKWQLVSVQIFGAEVLIQRPAEVVIPRWINLTRSLDVDEIVLRASRALAVPRWAFETKIEPPTVSISSFSLNGAKLEFERALLSPLSS